MPQTTLLLFKHLNVIKHSNSSTVLPQLLFHYILITNLAVFNLLKLPQMVVVLQSLFVTLIQSEYIILNIKCTDDMVNGLL